MAARVQKRLTFSPKQAKKTLMKTKIIATVGPASKDCETLSRLIAAGVRIFRLNFSHGDASAFVDIIKTLRALEQEHETPLTLMQDLSGPKIRIGNLKDDAALHVNRGDSLLLGRAERYRDDLPFIPFNNETILAELEAGDKLVLADGTLQFRVTGREADGLFRIDASNAGMITSRKGLALPGKSIRMPALTEKDRKDLSDALDLGIDAVALSYVQTPQDIRDAKTIIRAKGKNIPVVAKLERRNAVDRLDAIIAEADIIMVARGDLGIECSLAELPAMQKRIIRACNKAAKPVIVATQMLLSMVASPTPTRAETTDVANAVLDGADCVMLSEETAMGAFPVETVRYMWEITTQAEEFMAESQSPTLPPTEGDTAEFLAYAASMLAERAHAKGIVAHTMSGHAARLLSARKPQVPVFGVTSNEATLRFLNFSWGVEPFKLPDNDDRHLARAEKFVAGSSRFAPGDEVIITASQNHSNTVVRGANLVKVYRK